MSGPLHHGCGDSDYQNIYSPFRTALLWAWQNIIVNDIFKYQAALFEFNNIKIKDQLCLSTADLLIIELS